MGKNKIIFVSVFLILLCSCQNSDKYSNAELISFSDFGEPVLLKGDNIVFDDILLKPVKMHLIDSVLILKNRNTEFIYDLFNISSKKKIGECVSFGIGPDEMIDPYLIPSGDSCIWILDKNKQTLNICDRHQLFDNLVLSIDKKIVFKEFNNNVAMLRDKGFVTSTFSQDLKLFCLFDFNGDTICTKGEYPVLPELNTNTEKLQGFVHDFIVNDNGNKIVVTYKRTDLIEYYDADMNLIKRIHGPEHFFPEIHQSGDQINTNLGEERSAFSFPLTVGDRIFMLYSGKVFNPANNDYLSDKILVFDWDGNSRRYYQLDIPIFDFAVDEKKGIIYGLTDKPESHIVQFKM